MHRKYLIAGATLCLAAVILLAFLYADERERAEIAAFSHRSSIHAYVLFVLLEQEDWTREEWARHVKYLDMAHISAGGYDEKYDDRDRICEAYRLIPHIPYEQVQEALDLLRTLRISYDTERYRMDVIEGDIAAVIEGLKGLCAA